MRFKIRLEVDAGDEKEEGDEEEDEGDEVSGRK